MFVASYRNTEASVRRIAQERKLVLVAAPKPSPEDILEGARADAESIREAARADALRIIEEANANAARILGRAGLVASELVDVPLASDIIAIVARERGISVAVIKGISRAPQIVDARHEAIARVHLARPDLSLPQIGRIFHRDHTSILHALRKLGVYRGDEPSLPQGSAS